MKFGSACARVEDLGRTVTEVCDKAHAQLDGAEPDLVLVFITSHFEDESPALALRLTQRFPSAVVVGCSAEGVLGPQGELERVPSVSVLLARLPGARLTPFRADAEVLTGPEGAHAWIDSLRPPPSEPEPTFLLLADPFSVPINSVLKLFNQSFRGRPVLGGMVSGCEGPEQAVLILNGEVYRNGAIGIRITGGVDVRTVVSQGCRPLGSRFVITKGQRNVIQQLGGKPALVQLRTLLGQLSGDDLVLAEQSLFVGIAIDERKDQFKRGDYVIRHLLAGDPNSGALMVGDEIRVGTSVQFHVRDHHSADEDLRTLLASTGRSDAPAGALMFTCNGRGTRMWREPNHDVSALNDVCGPVPLAGFFAAGELGPVEGKNFIHGHTASIGLFYASRSEHER